jgi:D-serine deaminase-like pyridoxal phosphate-dependent protein
MSIFDAIIKPTLLLDEKAARTNIARMALKAAAQGVRFRPHFKTHQSIEIGDWFRPHGVSAITVTSLEMAEYFAAAGWVDITIAFPVNLRQAPELDALARRVQLGLLVESLGSVRRLAETFTNHVDVWIKVDTGNRRTGLPWDDVDALASLAAEICLSDNMHLRGVLTHAGNTYSAGSPAAIRKVYAESVERMNAARRGLVGRGFNTIEVSVGDTPGCTLSENLGEVDEIRPGNFVFYDAEQLAWGVCLPQDVAVAVACPVVALHLEREEVVLYGGAIHLSKDFMQVDGHPSYGKIALPIGERWGDPLPGAYVAKLSQEHGVVYLPARYREQVAVGELLCVIPTHSCLTVQVMGTYTTLDGRKITVR